MNQILETGIRRLNAQLALQNLEAVRKFKQSSSKLTKWLIGFTVVLVILTIAITFYTVVLSLKGHPFPKTTSVYAHRGH